MAQVASIIVSAKDKASKTFRQIGGAMDRFKSRVRNSTGVFQRMRTSIGNIDSSIRRLRASLFAVTFAFIGLTLAMRKLFKNVEEATGFEDMVARQNEALDKLKVNGDEFRQTIREVTNGMISDLDIVQQANFGLFTGVSPENLTQLFKIARGASKALGISVKDAASRIIRGIATGYSITLRRAGIVTEDLNAILKKQVEQGKMTEEQVKNLTKAQKANILATEVITKSTGIYAKALADFGFSDWLQVIAADQKNLTLEMGKANKFILTPFLETWSALIKFLNRATKEFNDLQDTTKAAMGTLGALGVLMGVLLVATLAFATALGVLLTPMGVMMGLATAVAGSVVLIGGAFLAGEKSAGGFLSILKEIGLFSRALFLALKSNITRVDEFGNALKKHFKFQMGADVWNELSTNSQDSISVLLDMFELAKIGVEAFGTAFTTAISKFLKEVGDFGDFDLSRGFDEENARAVESFAEKLGKIAALFGITIPTAVLITISAVSHLINRLELVGLKFEQFGLDAAKFQIDALSSRFGELVTGVTPDMVEKERRRIRIQQKGLDQRKTQANKNLADLEAGGTITQQIENMMQNFKKSGLTDITGNTVGIGGRPEINSPIAESAVSGTIFAQDSKELSLGSKDRSLSESMNKIQSSIDSGIASGFDKVATKFQLSINLDVDDEGLQAFVNSSSPNVDAKIDNTNGNETQ